MKEAVGGIIIMVIVLVLGYFVFVYLPAKEENYTKEVAQANESESPVIDFTEANKFYGPDTDQNIICYYYRISESGRYIYCGRCIGYGIAIGSDNGPDESGIEQAPPESNPNEQQANITNQSARWLLVIDEKTGKTYRSLIVTDQLYISPVKVDRRMCEYYLLPNGY